MESISYRYSNILINCDFSNYLIYGLGYYKKRNLPDVTIEISSDVYSAKLELNMI